MTEPRIVTTKSVKHDLIVGHGQYSIRIDPFGDDWRIFVSGNTGGTPVKAIFPREVWMELTKAIQKMEMIE